MGFPWKKFGAGFRKGIDIAAMFEPHIAILDTLIEGAEAAIGDGQGADKKAAVVKASDAILQNALLALRPEEVAAIQKARDRAIDAIVAAKNAEAVMEGAIRAFKQAVAEVKQ